MKPNNLIVSNGANVGTGRTSDAAISPTTEDTNLTVLAGTSVKFGCETDTGSRIRWNFVHSRRQLPLPLYTGFVVVGGVAWRISVNATSSWNEITVKNVSAKDAGAYSCHEVKKYSRKFSFYLAVDGTTLFIESFHLLGLFVY